MDFGIARAIADANATMTQTQAVIGTAQYLSPEQAQGLHVDARSDLYSTGCLLFELLTGRPPFKGDSPVAIAYQHVGEAPPRPSSFNPDVDASLDAVVLHALVKDREARYQDATAFRADLQAARLGRPISAAARGTAPAQRAAGGHRGHARAMGACRGRRPRCSPRGACRGCAGVAVGQPRQHRQPPRDRARPRRRRAPAAPRPRLRPARRSPSSARWPSGGRQGVLVRPATRRRPPGDGALGRRHARWRRPRRGSAQRGLVPEIHQVRVDQGGSAPSSSRTPRRRRAGRPGLQGHAERLGRAEHRRRARPARLHRRGGHRRR